MTRKLKAKVNWPDLHTTPDTWSKAELRAVCINPIATGMGRHPRSISDEDWVLSCERDVQENGLAQFLTDLLYVLRLTIPRYLGEPQPIGDYPQRRSEGEVPLPSVSFGDDHGWNDDGWNKEMVGVAADAVVHRPTFGHQGMAVENLPDRPAAKAPVMQIFHYGLPSAHGVGFVMQFKGR